MGATCTYPNPSSKFQKEERCSFSQSYTEGSSWKAYQVEDVVYPSGNNMIASTNPSDIEHSIPFMFGCQTSANGLFVTQLANGIMGMSAYETTLAKQMYNQGKIDHNMFSLCFRHEIATSKEGIKAGFMTLGGVDERLDISSPMVYAKNIAKSGWYTVNVKNMFLSTESDAENKDTKQHRDVIKIPIDVTAVNSGKGVIVDSGTTDTYLNEKLESSFAAVWQQVTGQTYSHKPLALTQEQVKKLPTVLIQIEAHGASPNSIDSTTDGLVGNLDPKAPNDVLLSIKASSYMEYSPKTRQYTSRLYFTETSGGVIGANAMQGHNVLFDWENGRVGFAKSSCEYKEDDQVQLGTVSVLDNTGSEHASPGTETSLKESEERDCILSESSLSKSCIESVDTSKCESSPTDILEGTETWTRIVEDPGTAAGRQCVDTVLFETMYRGDESIRVECNGSGYCLEHRPCNVRCQEVSSKLSVKPAKQPPTGKEDECADSAWSTCDYSCNQSRMQSVRMSDGICHETSLETRPCHFGVCGSSDPCRVPYVVHANLAFQGAKLDLWRRQDDESLAQALAIAVKDLVKSKESPFQAGDVNVLAVSPLYAKGQDGLDISVQISIFNGNAYYESDTASSDASAFRRAMSAVVESFQQNGQSSSSSFDTALSSCDEEDLYPLAQHALKIVNALEDDFFMESLIFDLKKVERESNYNLAMSPFRRIYKQQELAAKSRVTSSWTTKTQTEQDAAGKEKGFIGGQLDMAAMMVQVNRNCKLMGFMTGLLLIVWGLGMLCGWHVGKDTATVRRLTTFESSVIETLRYVKATGPHQQDRKRKSKRADIEDGQHHKEGAKANFRCTPQYECEKAIG